MAVILESAGEEVPHEVDDGIVESPHVSLVDGGIIFVHDDDRRDLVMLVEQFGKQCIFNGRFAVKNL